MSERDPAGGRGTFIPEDVRDEFIETLEKSGVTDSDEVQRLVEEFAREGREGGFSATEDDIAKNIADIRARLGGAGGLV